MSPGRGDSGRGGPAGRLPEARSGEGVPEGGPRQPAAGRWRAPRGSWHSRPGLSHPEPGVEGNRGRGR